MTIGATRASAVGHPGRSDVALASVEGIRIGPRHVPGPGFGVVSAAIALLAVVIADAPRFAVHLVQRGGGKNCKSGNCTIGVRGDYNYNWNV